MFARERNIIAAELAELFPELEEKELLQTTRGINVAQLQKVTYQEWLPAFLGDDTGAPEFTGFDEEVELLSLRSSAPLASALGILFSTMTSFRSTKAVTLTAHLCETPL